MWTGSVLAVISVFASSMPAASKDLNQLAEFVRPAYTAMNYAMVCIQHDPLFLDSTSGPRGTPLHYAQHVKDEAIEQLTGPEADFVLKTAADAARRDASAKIRSLVSIQSDGRAIDFVPEWCSQNARSLVLDYVLEHDRTHELTERLLEAAKQ